MAGRAGRRLIAVETTFSGRHWRILFADRQAEALAAARDPEGWFHHDRQPALHACLTRNAAALAVDSYCRHDGPPRVIVPLWLERAQLLDFRDPETNAALGLDDDETTMNWRNHRAANS